MNNTTPPLTTGDVARMFGVATNTVKQWAVAGRLPYFRTPGGHYRFQQPDVERLRETSNAAAAFTPEAAPDYDDVTA